MRFFRAALTLVPLLALSGCGYVHFGKLPAAPATDGALDVAYSDLSTRHKILQQELALARKEGDTLRAALDNRTDGAGSAQLTARLTETARELAALRVSYAKLQASVPSEANRAVGSAKAGDPALATKLAATEEQLATTLRSFTELRQENTRLQLEVDHTHAENQALTAQVKAVTAENQQAQFALAQLNTELLAQKEARARAEQQAEAVRSQLSAVMTARDTSPATLSSARSSSAGSTAILHAPSEASRGSPPTTALATAGASAKADATLKIEPAPPSEKPAPAELRTSAERIRAVAEQRSDNRASATKPPRIHVVGVGDTLSEIAKKYYGDTEKWNVIYFANNAQLGGGRLLKPGMELEIPEN